MLINQAFVSDRIGWTGPMKLEKESKQDAAEIFFSFKSAKVNKFVFEQTILDLVARFTDCAVVDVAIKQYTINTVCLPPGQ